MYVRVYNKIRHLYTIRVVFQSNGFMHKFYKKREHKNSKNNTILSCFHFENSTMNFLAVKRYCSYTHILRLHSGYSV